MQVIICYYLVLLLFLCITYFIYFILCITPQLFTECCSLPVTTIIFRTNLYLLIILNNYRGLANNLPCDNRNRW